MFNDSDENVQIDNNNKNGFLGVKISNSKATRKIMTSLEDEYLPLQVVKAFVKKRFLIPIKHLNPIEYLVLEKLLSRDLGM